MKMGTLKSDVGIEWKRLNDLDNIKNINENHKRNEMQLDKAC